MLRFFLMIHRTTTIQSPQIVGIMAALTVVILGRCLCVGAEALAQPFPARSNGDSETLFQRLASQHTGIDVVHHFPAEAPFDMLTDQGSGIGVCLGDIDGDGFPDLFFTHYNQGNRLYRNLGDFRFEEVSEQAGVRAEGRWCGGATFVDIDNDGDLDLFVGVYGAPNLLFVNRGPGVFDERAKDFGLDFTGASVMMAFADYDQDGDLDGYLVTHRLKTQRKHLLPKSTREALSRKIILAPPGRRPEIAPDYRELFQLMKKGEGRLELIIAGQQDRLMRNDGPSGFKLANVEAGILGGYNIGLAASWWDYNDDGRLDLYVSNDYKGADRLYRNQGDGRFKEVVREALPHVPWFSMGSDIGDINNDGRMDLLATDMSGTDHFKQKMGMGNMQKNEWFLIGADPQQYMRNAVFLGTGTERVFEAAFLCGLANTDWTWSPKFGDLDNDGRIDLFVSNGMSRDFMNSDLAGQIKGRDDLKWRDTPVFRQHNLAFRNRADLDFEEVGRRWGLDDLSASYGAALGDLDRDGDLDLVVTNFDAPVSVYRNSGQTGHSITIRLVGRASNRWGVGAKVTLQTKMGLQTRQLSLAQGFMSSNEPLIHVGLGSEKEVHRLTILWPSGIRQELTQLKANRHYVIREGISKSGATEPPAGEMEPLFEGIDLETQLIHRERDFDDYDRQPLLPMKQSQFGPRMAIGDVDGDGTEDVFLGGASGQSGTLWLRRDEPVILRSPFAADYQSEDMDCLFFDAEGDGDLDLYVVSGGVECEPDAVTLRDRLYLNQGAGQFVKASPQSLPDRTESGSVVCAADIDRDGDLDLFVGGRSVPGQYPLAADNQLLQNNGGEWIDIAAEIAGLAKSGIVTGAVWSDANQDGWLDLLITHEWGPVKLFLNQQGRLIEQTEHAGLDHHTGWWSGIADADLDHDGDADYIVTNVGLNTKYHANMETPLTLYYGDVDGSGQRRLIETKYEGNIRYPERGRSCSIHAMPSLLPKFPTFEAFALAPLDQVYPEPSLESALAFEVNALESGVLLNDGDARFRFVPLPRLAQISPSNDIAVSDVDADGHVDVLIVQNNYSPQPETGRMAGGLGLLLKGNGDGEFTVIQPLNSGFSVDGDAKSIAILDLNTDGRNDILVGINNGPIRAFQHRGHAKIPGIVPQSPR